jgi:inner membrane protein
LAWRSWLTKRLWSKDGDPGPTAWGLAFVSLILPVVGVGAGFIGLARIWRGLPEGWTWLCLGSGLICLDLVIDLIWAHPGVSRTDEPHLNHRGEQLIGRLALVVEPIRDGRGKVQIGDGVWLATGPDLPCGCKVRVIAAIDAILEVAPMPPPLSQTQ